MKLTKLKVGDKVIVDLDVPKSSWHKAEGVVIAERTVPGYAKVRVTKHDAHPADVGLETTLCNLTLLEDVKPELKVGDTVKVTGYSTSHANGWEGRVGKVSVRGARRSVALDLVPDVRPGDAVLVHAGLALARWREERPWEEDPPCA